MKRILAAVLVIGLSEGAPGGRLFGQTNRAIGARRMIEEAKLAHSAGDAASALKKLQQAQEEARKAGDRVTEVDAALRQAHVVGLQPGAKNTSAQQSETYRLAMERGTQTQQIIAHNALAVSYIKEKNFRAATNHYGALDASRLEPQQRTVYFYNFATALEGCGSPKEAYRAYVSAVRQQPNFVEAAEGAFRAMRQVPDPPIVDAAELAQHLYAHGQTITAGQQVRQCLDQWRDAPGARRLLVVLADHYADARLDLDRFKATEDPMLVKLAEGSRQLAAPISDIRQAYLEEHMNLAQDNRGMFPAWDPQGRMAFSRLLKMTGEIYDRRSEPRQALPRYWNAWILENRNTDAALYAANLLADNAPSLDPAGELFNTLLRRIFETKGEFLNTGDKLGAQRLNILLGSIFDRRQKWGNEADPFGCIFHWRRALWLEGGLAAKDKDAAREAVLHQRLGEAYQHAHRDPDAWPEYAAAVEKFEESGVPSEAAESFKGLESLRITLSPGQGERLKQLQAKVREAAREP